ncbi:putative transposase, Ptta/En/Spm, plant [Sesbania bispinosa]|nr:putative transposase, Ptta/En/Spm, plant [Sesbania bispinosa]
MGKRKKIIPMCGSMLIYEFLKENGEVGEEEELGDESANEKKISWNKKKVLKKKVEKQMKIQLERAKKENREEITPAKMFIETRKSRKGKDLDKETQSAIAKLEDLIQNSTEAKTFQSLFGNEKPGRVRCYGKTVTPSILKKKEEIAVIKKQHSNEVTGMKREMEGLKSLVKTMLKQQNPDLNEEEVNNMMAAALGYENSIGLCSSASSHVPHQEETFLEKC